jgi:hypothetical protein
VEIFVHGFSVIGGGAGGKGEVEAAFQIGLPLCNAGKVCCCNAGTSYLRWWP